MASLLQKLEALLILLNYISKLAFPLVVQLDITLFEYCKLLRGGALVMGMISI